MKIEAASCAETNYNLHIVMSQKTEIFISKSTATANRIETYWLKVVSVMLNVFSSIFTNISVTNLFQFDNSISDLQISLSL
jgi:hypothetical protein